MHYIIAQLYKLYAFIKHIYHDFRIYCYCCIVQKTQGTKRFQFSGFSTNVLMQGQGFDKFSYKHFQLTRRSNCKSFVPRMFCAA